MKTNINVLVILFSICLCINCQGTGEKIVKDTTNKQTLYYAVEIDGSVCGYSEIDVMPARINDKDFTYVESDVKILLSLMDRGMDMKVNSVTYIDPETNRFFYKSNSVNIGETNIETLTTVEDKKVTLTSNVGAPNTTLEIENDVILDIPTGYPHLFKDFIQGGVKEKTYRVLDEQNGEIVEKPCKLVGEEILNLAGNKYEVMVIDELHSKAGYTIKLYMSKDDGEVVKYNVAGKRIIYIADKSVKKQLTTANLSNELFIRTETKINKVKEISFMKVEAVIQTHGEWVSAESLNIPGQNFTGTVENNLIDGVFEISFNKYDGINAPSFPVNISTEDEIHKWLSPENLIESDDPELVNKAKQIGEGSLDAWEAVKRLSNWVANYVEPDLPGGTSARNTYDTKKGECGSHSRLLIALCRGAGIPARPVMGCAYTNNFGGSFGQHMWVEVYMGVNGWIPIDATFEEHDYVDSGHIRLGEKTTFNPKSMKIIDYKL